MGGGAGCVLSPPAQIGRLGGPPSAPELVGNELHECRRSSLNRVHPLSVCILSLSALIFAWSCWALGTPYVRTYVCFPFSRSITIRTYVFGISKLPNVPRLIQKVNFPCCLRVRTYVLMLESEHFRLYVRTYVSG